MTLIVEDGTGLSDSNSYASVEEIDAYFSERGIISWNQDGNKEHLLIIATDYLDAVYGESFQGVKKTENQALCFPRYNQGASMLAVSQSLGLYSGYSPFLNDLPSIPNQLKKACYELAKIASSQDLYPIAVDSADSNLDSKKVVVGPITIEKKSRASQNIASKNIYHNVEYILAPILINKNSVIR